MRAYFAQEIIAEQGPLEEAYLLEDGGVITGVVKELPYGVSVEVYEGCFLAPGLIDVHTHGALGYETGFGEKEGLRKWSEFEMMHGVTGFLPTAASIPLERIRKAADDVRELAAQPHANILGLHMEGPFFAPGEKIGAQNPKYIRKEFTPEYKEFLTAYRGVVKYIAVDPALETAEEIVTFCAGQGILVSAAHSSIAYVDFLPKKNWGFSGITHTFNGMNGLDHRLPGLAYAACMDRDLFAEIICDGHHVSYLMAKLFFQLKDRQKSVLITDSLAATGMPRGMYTLGDIQVELAADGKATKWDGGLAGSTITLDQAVRNLVQILNLPLHEAILMASTVPARMLGMDRFKGCLGPGKDADFIVLNSDLNVIATYIKGKNMFSKGPDQIN